MIDLGVVEGGRRFAFAAGVGIDSRMVESTPTIHKRRLGVLAYVITAARAVLANEAFDVRATVDGIVHERRAAMVMITNFGTVLDELISLGPGISQDDGLLDLCVFSPGSVVDAVRIAWRLLRKDFRPHPLILYAPGRRFVIETSPVRRAQADGELLGSTPLVVHVEPRAGRLLVPRRD
jgi:diacylglycerol kinase family enzyme